MTPAGVIRNPRSQRNRVQPLLPTPLPAGVTLAMPQTPAALAEALRHFAESGIRHLLVDGGDGTLRDVLGQLPQAYGSDWPSIALCASGNTNLAAGDVGSFARRPTAIQHWLDTLSGAKPSRRSTRQPIAVCWPDQSRAPVFGFFVGCANYTRAVAMATGSLRERGFFHSWAVAGTIAAAGWQVLTGGPDNHWQRGSLLSLGINQQAPTEARRFVVLATSLEKLVLGIWPFWSEATDTPGLLHYLDIRAPAPRFGSALPALLRGKPKPWMHASAAYQSGSASQLSLQLSEPLIVDGEAFEPDSNGRLLLKAGPTIEFYAPA